MTTPSRRDHLWLIALTLLVTSLNAIKPLHIDDGNIFGNANQLAHRPLDPYGYKVFWIQWPEPAAWMLVPPGLPYWWSIAIRLFGDSPLAWKIWLAPIVAVFVFSLHHLFKRFTPGLEMPLVWFTALSPTFLPAVNLMLDVPAMALGLAALCVAMSAIDRGSFPRAIAAGLIAGLAMETKYTAAVIPAAIFIYGATRLRWWFACVPGLVALAVFVAWESFVAHLYGMSQFMFALGWSDIFMGAQSKTVLLLAFVTLIGGLAPAVAVLATAALNFPFTIVVAVALASIAGFAVLLVAPAAVAVFATLGTVTWLAVLLVARRLLQRLDRDDLFLLLWFALEIAAFFAISPFAASRRAMGIVLLMTVTVGRLASRADLRKRRPKLFSGAIAFGILLGLCFFGVDLLAAMAEKRVVDQAAAIIEPRRHPGENVWFTGHWSVQFYARRQGYEQVVPDHSQLRQGDWLIYAEAGLATQHVGIEPAQADPIADIFGDDPVPVSGAFYYGGWVPIEHRDAPRLWFRVFRVTEDFIPPTTYTPEILVKWAATRKRPLPPMAVKAVVHASTLVDPESARAAIKAIGDSGPDALCEALVESDPDVRRWAAEELGVQAAAARSAIPALRRAAADDVDPSVREAAARALARVNAAAP